ncbi:hypothetical protein BpHYR1_053468 [Brachionus plicatilis]|uniref:Uncharacterized protein n=1 Tax=Brachionus plicatilis TaxID=10195 RepID=A0A3M7RTK5_BRAPC|nr:hypothetical protein BpHYR1_053468 [Brachionus plicatilis]
MTCFFDFCTILYNLDQVSKYMLILDHNLSIDFDQKYLSKNTYFTIANIIGIDIFSSPFYSISTKTELSVDFFFTYFQLFLNGSEIRECSRDNFNAFKNINSIKFSSYVKYYHETCPYIFSNLSNLTQLEFHGISDIFLKKNYISFTEIVFSNIEEAESDCLFAFRKLSWLKIDFFNLDALLSRNSEWLFNNLNQIDIDLFLIFVFGDVPIS